MSRKSTFELVPRWVVQEDILRGWIVLHSSKANLIKLRHLDHAVIRCRKTNKKIFCRVIDPDTPDRGRIYYNRYTKQQVQNSIFLDAYYLEQLNLPHKVVGRKAISFEISKGGFWVELRTCLNHPEDAIRIGSRVGLISVILAYIGIAYAIFH